MRRGFIYWMQKRRRLPEPEWCLLLIDGSHAKMNGRSDCFLPRERTNEKFYF